MFQRDPERLAAITTAVLWAALASLVPAQEPDAEKTRSQTYYDHFARGDRPSQPAAATVDLEAAPRVSWTAATGGVWSDAGNWSGGAVPGEGDHAVIDLDGTYTVTLDGDARIAGLTLGAASGTQILVVPRDAIALSSAGTVGPGAVLELAGGRIGGDGDLVVHGRVVWSGGTMTGRGKTRITAAGRLEIVGDQRKILSLRHIENAGSMVWRDRGDLMVTFAAQIRNLEGGAFEVASGALLDVYGPAGPAVDNAGTLHVAAAGTTTFETPLINSGTVEIAAGGLRLPAGYTQTAGVTRLDSALLAAGEILIGGGELVGDGTLEGTVTNAGRIDPGAASGRIEIVGDYLQTDAGELRLDLGGPGERVCDVLAVSAQATLGGVLELVRRPSAELAGGALEVLRFARREGEFARLTGLEVAGGEILEPRFVDGGLILESRGGR